MNLWYWRWLVANWGIDSSPSYRMQWYVNCYAVWGPLHSITMPNLPDFVYMLTISMYAIPVQNLGQENDPEDMHYCKYTHF
jgi:hypothetical protein